MSYRATVYNVMIASPSDVTVERTIIREIISEWNSVNSNHRQVVLLPIGWESHSSPEMGDRPQAIINKQVLKDADLLIGVFWTRIGTATGEYDSGTIEEIEEHIKAGKPAMLYFSSVPIMPESVDRTQYEMLIKFKESCINRGLFETYNNQNDFKNKFYRQLQLKMNDHEYFKVVEDAAKVPMDAESSISNIPQLSREAQTLLKEASQDSSGFIICLHFIGGTAIQTNGKNFAGDGSPRIIAIWEGALQELEQNGLIEAQGYKNESFKVTREGYELAELLNP